jgi:hypothetical protein
MSRSAQRRKKQRWLRHGAQRRSPHPWREPSKDAITASWRGDPAKAPRLAIENDQLVAVRPDGTVLRFNRGDVRVDAMAIRRHTSLRGSISTRHGERLARFDVSDGFGGPGFDVVELERFCRMNGIRFQEFEPDDLTAGAVPRLRKYGVQLTPGSRTERIGMTISGLGVLFMLGSITVLGHSRGVGGSILGVGIAMMYGGVMLAAKSDGGESWSRRSRRRRSSQRA